MRKFIEALEKMPILAILRGITPKDVISISKVLLSNGISALEVPLNSPDAFTSIRLLSEYFGKNSVIGAGTVMHPEEVDRLVEVGAQIVVSPNFNPDVVTATQQAGLISVPGVFTATEAFAALDAGANALKIFPGDGINPNVIRGLRAVLPESTHIVVTGGVNSNNLLSFLDSGACGAGIGSALYKAGQSPDVVGEQVGEFISAINDRKGDTL